LSERAEEETHSAKKEKEMQNRLSLLKKRRKPANGWIKALSKKRKNLDRLSVKNVDFFSGLKAIIAWQIEKAFS
jgi:hypothetical protein